MSLVFLKEIMGDIEVKGALNLSAAFSLFILTRFLSWGIQLLGQLSSSL